MSSALAIAAVTAVLKDLLDNRLVQQGIESSIGDVVVTALPPDRIAVGPDERAQVNLFLYRVTPHTGWRNYLSNGANGDEPEPAPPLALDLHYLITAYGQQDFQAEILLGYAMQLLHETSVITPEVIRSTLHHATMAAAGGVVAPAQATLAGSTIADQVEQLTIVAEFMSAEESSKIWSALQARYRPSASYKISTVLIESGQ